MRFTKMHGAGNDYIYVDCFSEVFPAFDEVEPADVPELTRRLCHRHEGIGADGLILIGPSRRAHARMRIWNADGSPAEMCGNGLRCVAKYLYDHGYVGAETLTVETGRGILTTRLSVRNGHVERVAVGMGEPILPCDLIPTRLAGEPPLDVAIDVPDSLLPNGVGALRVSCVSMGNPHCVVFVDELNDRWVKGVGPALEHHAAFPNRTNVEFVQVLARDRVRMRVWERGAGETLACGTGACAAVVAGALSGRISRHVFCELPGGELEVHWQPGGAVQLTGPAAEVFSGEWRLPGAAAIQALCRPAIRRAA